MANFQKVDFDITHLKPKMKAFKSLRDVPLQWEGKRNITVQVKADGEFNYVKYSREHETFLLNRFGRKTTDLPCLNELIEHLKTWNIVEAEILAELYAVDKNGKPLTLPNLIHFLKGGDEKLWSQIKLGVFELVSLNGVNSSLIYSLKFTQMEQWFQETKLVHILPWIEPNHYAEVETYWKVMVEGEHWEGLILRQNGETFKVKPNNDIDCVILGINKNNKGYEQGKAKSLKIGLMNEDGSFVEIGDCAGIGEEESKELFKLTSLKIGEDNTTLFIKPLVVITVEYIETYPDTRNKRYIIEKGEIFEKGEQILVRLRNPHVKAYRKDKKVCVEDVGLNQIS
jgi:ATP-dependent DNA ligase